MSNQTQLARRAMLGGAALATFAALSRPTQAQSGPITVIADLVATPGREAAVRDVLVPFALAARQEPGCLHYTLMEALDEPGHFVSYEIWADRAAADAHLQTPQIKAAGAEVIPLLAEPFTQLLLKGLT